MHNKLFSYLALTKPGLTFVVVSTAVGGAYLVLAPTMSVSILGYVFIGTYLAGGGAGALNQYLEREHDARMTRTGLRPLPAKILSPVHVLIFGCILAVSGVLFLAFTTTQISAFLTAVTLVIYLVLYTPLKRRTPFATIIGGIAGALPPLIGCTAVEGRISMGGLSLFCILFFWQTPHFLSLAWIYRDDYRRAGYNVITVADPSGEAASRQILINNIVLIPASLMPVAVGLADGIYAIGALVASLAFLLLGMIQWRTKSLVHTRYLFIGSIIYLPILFILLIVSKL